MTTYAPVLVTAPAVLPVSLEEVKMHLREDSDDQDAVIDIYLNAAVTHLDGPTGWLGRSIVAQTWSQQFDAFASELLLGVAPVSSIASVKYRDAADAEQTVTSTNYALINGGTSLPALRFIDDFEFPIVRHQRPVLTVTMVSGFGDDEAAPAPIKSAILLIVGDLFLNREATLENSLAENKAVRMLLTPYRARFMA